MTVVSLCTGGVVAAAVVLAALAGYAAFSVVKRSRRAHDDAAVCGIPCIPFACLLKAGCTYAVLANHVTESWTECGRTPCKPR